MDNVYSSALTGHNGSKATINPLLVLVFFFSCSSDCRREANRS